VKEIAFRIDTASLTNISVMAAFLATVTAITPAIVIFGLAVHAFCRKRPRLDQQPLYSDSDGQATQSSMAEHRKSLRFSTFSTILIDFLGLVVSIATAFRIALSGHDEPVILLSNCLRASNWVSPHIPISRYSILTLIESLSFLPRAFYY